MFGKEVASIGKELFGRVSVKNLICVYKKFYVHSGG